MFVCFVICDVWKWLRRKWIKVYKDYFENSKWYLFVKVESFFFLFFFNYDLDLLFWWKKSEFFLLYLLDFNYYYKKVLLI